MVYSGVYRPQLAGRPEEIDAEIDHLRRVLGEIAPYAADRGMTVEIENASDFTTAEIERLLAPAPPDGVALFLDLTNPYNVFDDPIAAVARLGPLATGGHVKDFVLDSLYSFAVTPPDRARRPRPSNACRRWWRLPLGQPVYV